MEPRQLTYFLAIVEHGGFGRAAEHLHVAQPSLSQSIAALERELGVKLFHRVGRGAVLSDAGTELIAPARRVLRDLEAAKAAARSVTGLRQGTVHLSTMPSPGLEPLTSMIAKFARAHPAIVLSVDGAFGPEEVIEAVRSGSAEIGLLGTAEPPRVPGLQVVPLEAQPLVLISPPEAELPTARHDGAQVRLVDLPDLRLIVSQRGSLMRRLVDDTLAHGASAHIAVELAHRTSILPLVLAGVGHAVMPSSWTLLAERAGAQVHAIHPLTHLHIALLHRADDLTPAANAFLTTVATAQAPVAGARRSGPAARATTRPTTRPAT
ncbi:LysR family transcriptional regulator [Kineococcus sp. SYSU DK005]|uniref:LysR family transcriptional regulator n=1 Tax=Kineococcus sp. SYSU DK005 TaxID=3383126 RepID=UPI003D7C7A2B